MCSGACTHWLGDWDGCGFGACSFDGAVLERTHSLLADQVIKYVKDDALRSIIVRAMFETAEEPISG